ncbi:unnamed protein product [Hymenolepis diminuta]|uniref:Uncharacterized protein n=1 Tax=Hymenolepis diminuta TaxID=6216 RepID=A0A564YAZ3_HYMDI|nr:unnamed protein product [Hymenolepis diminuta]
MDVCCRIFKIIKESDNITLEVLDNECWDLNIKCDSGITLQNPGVHNYVNQIACK